MYHTLRILFDSKTVHKINKIYLISTSFSAFMIYMSPFITRLVYPEEYYDASNVLRVLFLVIPFSFLWDLYGKQGFVISKLPSFYAYSNIIAIVILCSFLLINNSNSVTLSIFYVLAEAGAYIFSCSYFYIHYKFLSSKA